VSDGSKPVIILWIGIGGFVGAILRYWISGWIQAGAVTFPVGTLAVNFLGSFFLAMVMFLSEFKGYFNEETRIFLSIGLLGSFTTMSTFSYESFKLLEQQEHLLFSVNVIGSVALTLMAIYLGKIITLNL
jgi:CrcB protein